MVEFDVQDMSCGHCVATITKAVRALDPQARVEAEVAARRVRIDAAVAPEALEAALSEAGYPTRRLG
ncbi:MAG TPA: heavy-metal-associated domain-containing protein [Methylibium sp.]|nr:heavy-metal-associated domain-containing protein [Methylibium sp.]